MARVLVLILVVFVWGAVAISDASVNYGLVNTLLQSPLREEIQPELPASDEAEANTEPAPTSNATSNLDDVTIRDNEPNPLDDGISKMTEIYRECSKKIDKRVETLLNWKFSKTNTEKDLIQLKEYVSLLYRCLKVQTFRYFDTVIADDVIPVTGFVEFVKDGRSLGQPIFGPNGIGRNLPWERPEARVSTQYVSQVINNDWSALLLDRLSKLLETHSMKFKLDDTALEGRGRRRDQRMFAMMLMGFMIMASILIPMGFQFLTVLGGKSLLMAKMALIMSAINGLKKIATSQVGYGFYHTGPEGHDHGHHHGFHDKLFKIKREPEFTNVFKQQPGDFGQPNPAPIPPNSQNYWYSPFLNYLPNFGFNSLQNFNLQPNNGLSYFNFQPNYGYNFLKRWWESVK